MNVNQTTSSSIEPLTLANSSYIHQGQQVFAVGSPFLTDASYPNIVTSGIVSKPVHTVTTFSDGSDAIVGGIVSDQSIADGSSGGPLLNTRGEVIGMVTASDDFDQCCSYAVPSNIIKQVAPVLIEGEEYIHPWIGLIPRSLALSDTAQSGNIKGVAVHSIERDGPSHIAGLKGSTVNQFGELQMGDIITAVDGKPITTAEEFEAYIDQNKMIGENVDLTIYRNGTVEHAIVALE